MTTLPSLQELRDLVADVRNEAIRETIRKALRPLILDAAKRGVETVTIWEAWFLGNPACPDMNRKLLSEVMLEYGSKDRAHPTTGLQVESYGADALGVKGIVHWRISWAVLNPLPDYIIGERYRTYGVRSSTGKDLQSHFPRYTHLDLAGSVCAEGEEPKAEESEPVYASLPWPASYMSMPEAAKILKCSTTTVRNRIKQGKLPGAAKYVPEGETQKVWRIPQSAVEALAKSS